MRFTRHALARRATSTLAICALAFCAAFAGSATRAAAQASASTGALEFEAHVAASGAQPEPVRELTFYLLRKDLADIRKETSQSQQPEDMDHFIDSLEVSPELKVWMKKTRAVDFSGTAFTKLIKTDDILNVPEFLEAYKNLNGAILKVTLPTSQVKESDRTKNPAKYKRELDNYQKALREYIGANPQSIDGLDAELGDSNPINRWTQLQLQQKRRADQGVMQLAQTQYLAAKTVSDLNGRGAIRGLAPGNYWISTLDVPALAGDVHLEWDFPLTIRAGQTTSIELSNLNATPQMERMGR